MAWDNFDAVWANLSPREQRQLVGLLVSRVDFDPDDCSITLEIHATGMKTDGTFGSVPASVLTAWVSVLSSHAEAFSLSAVIGSSATALPSDDLSRQRARITTESRVKNFAVHRLSQAEIIKFKWVGGISFRRSSAVAG